MAKKFEFQLLPKSKKISFFILFGTLILIYLFSSFIRREIDLWDYYKDYDLAFQKNFSELVVKYEKGEIDQLKQILEMVNSERLSSKEKFKFYLLAVIVLKKEGHLLEAMEVIKQAHEIYSTAFSLTLYGMILEQIGQIELAEKTYLQVVETYEDYYPAYEKLGDLNYRRSQLQSGIDYYRQVQRYVSQQHSVTYQLNQLKRRMLEYLSKDMSVDFQIDLKRMKNFKMESFVSLAFILQGLFNLEKTKDIDLSAPTILKLEQRSLNAFEKAVQFAPLQQENYLSFLALLYFYFGNRSDGEIVLKGLVSSAPSENLFQSITFEMLGDHALWQKNYFLSRYYYRQIKNNFLLKDRFLNDSKFLISLNLFDSIDSSGMTGDLKDNKRLLSLEVSEMDMRVLERLVYQLQILDDKNSKDDLVDRLDFSRLIFLVNYLEKKQSWEVLYRLLDQYLNKNHAPPFLFKKTGDIAVYAGLLDQASLWYEKMIEQEDDPRLIAEGYNNWAKISMMKGYDKEAMRHLSTGLKFAFLPALYYNMSLVQKWDGNRQDSFYSLKRAHSILEETHSKDLAAKIYLELSAVLTYAKSYHRAKFYLDKSKQFDQNYAERYDWEGKNILDRL